jgi:hypothetical protein
MSASSVDEGIKNEHLVSLMSYRMELTELLKRHHAELSKVDLRDPQLKTEFTRLQSLFQITKQEHDLILDQVLSDSDSNSKLLFARLEDLVDLTALRLLLRSRRGESAQWDAVSVVMNRVLDEQVKQVLVRFLSTLRLVPEMKDSRAFALMASMYSGSIMDEVLESKVPTEKNRAWYEVFPHELVLSLASTHQDESDFTDSIHKKLKSLPRLHSLISNENRAIRVLSVKIQIEQNAVAALSYVLLAHINIGRANLAYDERMQGSTVQDLWMLVEQHHSTNEMNAEAITTNFEKFLLLANTTILKQISIPQVAEIARNSLVVRKKLGETVLARGEVLPAVLLLCEGQLVVEGKGKTTDEPVPGDFLGLANILSKKPFSKTIRVASARADFLSISADEITYLTDTDHQIASTMLRILAEAV